MALIIDRFGSGGGGGSSSSSPSNFEQVINFTAASDRANTTDRYLNIVDQTPSNESSYVLPFDGTIFAITSKTAEVESWTAEIRIGGIVVASSVISSLDKKVETVSVDVDSGDELQFYCNGTSINRPVVTVFIQRK
jgi:hypothetical protein